MNKANKKVELKGKSSPISPKYRKWIYTTAASLLLASAYLIIGEILELTPSHLRISHLVFDSKQKGEASLASSSLSHLKKSAKRQKPRNHQIRKSTSDEVTLEDLAEAIEEDFWILENDEQMPNEWFEVSKVINNFHSEWTEELFSKRPVQFNTSNSGNYLLEVEYLDSIDSEDPMLILQMSLINRKTKNKIWELSRPFLISLDKKKPG